MPCFNLQPEGCLTIMQGSLCWSTLWWGSSNPLCPPGQWCQTGKPKDTEKTRALLSTQMMRGKADERFWKGKCSSRLHRGWGRGRKAQKKQIYKAVRTVEWVLYNLGTCSIFSPAAGHKPHLTEFCTKEGKESHSWGHPFLCLYLQGKDQHTMI